MKRVFTVFSLAAMAVISACGDSASNSGNRDSVTGSSEKDSVEVADSSVVDPNRNPADLGEILDDPTCSLDELDGLVTVSCGDTNLFVYKGSCDSIAYDPKLQFCFEGRIMDFCEGFPYNPRKFFCQNDTLYSLCGNESYDVKSQFCYEDTLVDLCNGHAYDLKKQFCNHESSIEELCGGKNFDKEKQFCSGNVIYDLCSGQTYDVSKQFCSDNKFFNLCDGHSYDTRASFCEKGKVYARCEGRSYDPELQFCDEGLVLTLCNGKKYDYSTQFCYNTDKTIVSRCGGESYDIKKQFCAENVLYDLCDGKEFDIKTHFCDGKIIRELCGTEEYSSVQGQVCKESESGDGMSVYKLCGENLYDTKTSFCFMTTPYYLCDGKAFNVGTHYCKDGKQLVEYGYFVDSRDGHKYRYAEIGEQTWMAENLNYDPGFSNLKSYCYDDVELNCARYGRLYDVTEPSSFCPEGWHLPSRDEFKVLTEAFPSSVNVHDVLRARGNWDDYDGKASYSYGFLALPGGIGQQEEGLYEDVGESAYFLTSSCSYCYEGGCPIRHYIEALGMESIDGGYVTRGAVSVRCVKDNK